MHPLALPNNAPRTVVASQPAADRRAAPASPPSRATGGGKEGEQAVRASGASGTPGDTRADEARLRHLRRRDREVRAHENAHRAAGGRFVRGGHMDTEQGPDGRLYATGGDVRIDAAPIPGDAAATLEKAVVVRRAALAPADPSPQDRNVAARAARMAAQARAELARQRLAGEAAAPISPAAAGAGFYARLASEPEPQAIDLVV